MLLALMAASVAAAPDATAQPDTATLANDILTRESELADLRGRIDSLNALIQTNENDLDRRRQDLASATSRLRDAEDRYNASLKLYEGRVAALYKLDPDLGVKAIFASEGLSGAATTFSYLQSIADNDRRLAGQVKAEADEARMLREEIEVLKRGRNMDAAALKEERGELERQAAAAASRLEAERGELTRHEEQERAEYERLLASTAPPAPYRQGALVAADPPPGLTSTGVVLNGIASWYGPGFHGNRTANGEVYDMNAFTAAHKTLPFNTWVKVTSNGRSVFVRINDRGPYIGGRIIDLSRASAETIGLSGIGFVQVEIYR